MLRKSWGRYGQVRFASEQEYYRIIGYLARSKGETELTWEHNEEQGAWGSEGRIHFYETFKKFPDNFTYTAGRGSIIYRVNCNDFVEHLSNRFNFVQGKTQNIEAIRKRIPPEYQKYFEEGLKGMLNPPKSKIAPTIKCQTTQDHPITPPKKQSSWWNTLTCGNIVTHKTYGQGIILSIDNYIMVSFGGRERKFVYPDCFEQGYFLNH